MSNTFKDNPILGPLNSWFFYTISGYMNVLWGKSKKELFQNHPDTVVEIGSGAGANMRYLKRGTKLIAIEPNIHMHNNLRKTAKKYGINLDIKSITGEAIDLPDNSVDFVMSTLVLCTVENPLECLNQIRRILKTSGQFVFIEHVRARENSLLGFIQNLIHKPWHWFFEGCHTNRDTRSLLESIEFSSLDIECYNSYSPFIPIIPQIRGKAIK
ncbi:class I SAM-dependent methyltransferase [Kriegella aquimaris]|uniref:Methyltransferase domain-containing protein n=1 Tax=Kriegella aquimaris TaxID=192904 RepID=A0A1G9S8V5_9FLAO|nr:class I SAM-dependent methyltransferase [Kriegella aquimaris]SDM31899.1 Methyltransferase domain-containing protein [Kriegella aquimaris]